MTRNQLRVVLRLNSRITRMGGIGDVNGRTAVTRDKHTAELLLVQRIMFTRCVPLR